MCYTKVSRFLHNGFRFAHLFGNILILCLAHNRYTGSCICTSCTVFKTSPYHFFFNLIHPILSVCFLFLVIEVQKCRTYNNNMAILQQTYSDLTVFWSDSNFLWFLLLTFWNAVIPFSNDRAKCNLIYRFLINCLFNLL